MKYAHIIRAILTRPWAIDPESVAWAAICDVLALRAAGETLSDDEVNARIAAAANGPRQGGGRAANVAVIPIYGVISPRANLMSRTSGGVTAEQLLADVRSALADSTIDGIVFDVDSPGGQVEGIEELAAEIRGARGQKPMAAVANHLAASAAYWAIAGVDEIVATPSASVGSIGIFTAHEDISEAAAQAGVKTTLVSAGKYKVERNQFGPLSDEAKAAIQSEVDAWYATMTNGIAKGRRVSVDVVRSSYGEGRTLRADPALAAGMIDRIGSLEDTIRRVARGAVGQQRTAATANPTDIAALASGLPFSDRVALASALTVELVASAQQRTAIRATEGRGLSQATRDGFRAIGNDLLALAGEPEAAPKPDDIPAPSTAAPFVALDLEEAIARGGYQLPVAVGGTAS